MKKKVFAALILIVVVVTMVVAMTACSTGIFSVNEDRDYHQVIATVTYKDLSKEIYKGQLYSYVYSYGTYYAQNYSMTTEEIMEYFYNSLSRSALMTLYAKYYAYDNANTEAFKFVDTSKSISKLEGKDFISYAQYIYAIDQANSDILTSYNTLVEDLKKIDEKDEEDEDEDTEDTEDELAARTVRTFSDDSTSVYDEDLVCTSLATVYGEKYLNVTYKDIEGYTDAFVKSEFNVASLDELANNLSGYKLIQSKIDQETDKELKANMKSALKTLKSNIEKSYTSFEYFLEDKIDSIILKNMQNDLKEPEATEAEIEKAYNDLVNTDWKSYSDEDSFASAISSTSWMSVNASKDYTAVKSTLLKFSDEQSSALKAIATMYANSETKISELREMVALGQYDNDNIIKTLLGEEGSGIKVNVSNYKYDSTTDKLADAYTDKDVDYKVVLYAMANSVEAIANQIVAMYTDGMSSEELAENATNINIVRYNAKVEAYTQWMYLVNDDSGAFSSEYYTITPAGKASSYVSEYTVLAREIAKEAVASFALSTVSAAYENGSLEDKTYNSEYINANLGNKTYSISKDTFTTRNDSDKDITANVYTLTTGEGNAVSFCVNTYGIHVVMTLGNFGAEGNFGIVDDVKSETRDEVTAYVYKLNTIRDQGTTIKYDYVYTAVAENAEFDAKAAYYVWKAGSYEKAEIEAFATGVTYYTRAWVLKSVKCEPKTLSEYLGDTVIDNKYTDAYSVKQILLFFNEIDTDEGKYITKNTKVYDDLLDSLTSK